ncbi:MAG TPA: 5'-nucleotidase C-terminal domain-containing protein, partial [Gemmatimonadales bacterium]|nr:5'-nucleotidase C-terminal domain-containing protein [Gemmatimonadales bacterium]
MPLLPLLLALAGAPADTVRVVLVATTDLHGYATDWDYLQNSPWPGGLSRAVSVVDSLRLKYPGQVLVVDAGDALQGSIFAAYYGRETRRDPHPVIEAMNLMGYDAATPGDHDFDFGVDRFQQALAGASFPFVSANLRVLPADTLFFKSYVVVNRNGVRVAITGFTTPAAMVLDGDKLKGRMRVDRIEPRVDAVLREMRQDADFTVVLSHSGIDGGASYDTTGVGGENVSARIAAGALKPDLVVVGHSHKDVVDTVIGGVHFVQPRPEGRSLAVVYLSFVPKGAGLELARVKAERIPLEDVRPSERVQRRLLDPHRAVLGWVATRVGESERRLAMAAGRVEDVPAMRFIHEVQRRTARADLSAASVPDTKAMLDEGDITAGEVFRIYPAENTLRAIRISGAQLKAYLEQSARYFYADSTGLVATNRFVPPANYDVIGGAAYTIDLSRPMGQRITRLEVKGRPVAPADSFTLALPSSRQLGLGNFAMLAGAPVVYDKGEFIRDLLAADIRRRHTLLRTDFNGADWSLAPAELAKKARSIFVKDVVAGPEPVAETPPPLNLPVGPNAKELARRDSILREQDKAEAAARVTLVTMKLPAEPGAGKNLTRLVADAYMNALRADLSIVRSDEVGDRLPAGPLTAQQIAAALPGRSRMMVIPVTGAELEDILEHVVESESPCCEVAGVTVEFDPKAKPMERVKKVRLPGGKSIDRKRTYQLAVSEKVIEGDVFTLGATDCTPG